MLPSEGGAVGALGCSCGRLVRCIRRGGGALRLLCLGTAGSGNTGTGSTVGTGWGFNKPPGTNRFGSSAHPARSGRVKKLNARAMRYKGTLRMTSLLPSSAFITSRLTWREFRAELADGDEAEAVGLAAEMVNDRPTFALNCWRVRLGRRHSLLDCCRHRGGPVFRSYDCRG